jgi:VWFA-related protein
MIRRLFAGLLLAASVPAAFALDVFVRSPRGGQVVFGPVEVELELLTAADAVEVEVRLDGEVVGRLSEAPYRLVVDVGQENRSHVFEITAVDSDGGTATRTVTTGRVEVDMELDLELQQLYVTATRDGARVHDLERHDFVVLDGGYPQQLVTFERGDVPLTAVLLIDSSLSMQGENLRAALAGARAFVEEMRELDLAKVIVFSDRLLAVTSFTGDPRVVASVMDGVEAAGGTAINDHLYVALKQLETYQGRQVVVLLSDGVDIESVLGMDDVAWKAGRMQSLIYWIRPRDAANPNASYYSVWRDPKAHRHEIETLGRVVAASGGRVREIAAIADAPAAFREIVAELREQYVLGYYPAVNLNDGRWHEVKVRVRSPGVRVRARGGYFDDEAQ